MVGWVRESIAPFESLATGRESVDCVFEELDFDPRHMVVGKVCQVCCLSA
jgi:hypothetical protein